MVSSPFQVSIGTTAVQLVSANEKRTALGMANLHLTAIVYYSTDPGVSVANGFPIYPRTVRDINIGLGDNPTPGIFMISDTAATIVAVTEQFREEG